MPVCGQLLLSGYWGEGRHAIGQSTMLLGRVRRARARIRRIRACRRPGHAERVEPEIAWPEKAGHVTVKALRSKVAGKGGYLRPRFNFETP
jgi:hypothetical protein